MAHDFICLMGKPLASHIVKAFFEQRQLHYPITQYFSPIQERKVFRYGNHHDIYLHFELYKDCSPNQDGKFSPILTHISFDESLYHLTPIGDLQSEAELSAVIARLGESYKTNDLGIMRHYIWQIDVNEHCYWQITYFVRLPNFDDKGASYIGTVGLHFKQ